MSALISIPDFQGAIPHYSLVVISDWHLLMKNPRASAWQRHFIDTVSCDLLIANGDMLDGQRVNLHSPKDMPEEQKCVLDAINARIAMGLPVIFIPGNHDEELREKDIFGKKYHGIAFELNVDYRAPDGRLWKVMHGDEFEPEVWHLYSAAEKMRLDRMRVLDNAYAKMISICADIEEAAHEKLNVKFNPYATWSQVTERKLTRKFEERAVAFGREGGYAGIITGHTHIPYMKTFEDGFTFFNVGSGIGVPTSGAITLPGEAKLIDWREHFRAAGPASEDRRAYNKEKFRAVTERQIEDIRHIWPGRVKKRPAFFFPQAK